MADESEPAAVSADDDAAFAEGAITIWANLMVLIGTHLRETGTSRQEVFAMLHETNKETIRSPRAGASASRHLISVYRALGEA